MAVDSSEIKDFFFCFFLCFWSFAQIEKEFAGSVVSVVDVCLHAMEEGILPVITKQMGYLFLWEFFILTTDQWARTCALLQRHRLPPSLLWTLKTRVESTCRSRSPCCSDCPVKDKTWTRKMHGYIPVSCVLGIVM
jgi:hypothetical protein